MKACALTVMALMAVLIGGCGGQSTNASAVTPSPKIVATVTLVASDCALTPGGATAAESKIGPTFVNNAGIVTFLDVFEIPKPRTYAEAQAFIADEVRLAEAGLPGMDHTSFFTGSNPISHVRLLVGETFTAFAPFAAGMYAIVCLHDFPQAGVRPYAIAGPLTISPA